MDGIVVLNDGRISKFNFYSGDNPIADGLNGRAERFDKAFPTVLVDMLRKKGYLECDEEAQRELDHKKITVIVSEHKQKVIEWGNP